MWPAAEDLQTSSEGTDGFGAWGHTQEESQKVMRQTNTIV